MSYKERHDGHEIGLKPVVGGSIPSFLDFMLLRKLALRMYDKEEGIRVIILG